MTRALTAAGALGLLATLIGTLGGEAFRSPLLYGLAWVGLGLYLLDAWLHLGLKGRGFLASGLVMAAVTALAVDAPAPALAAGLNRAVFIATLFTALGMLREAAGTSDLVRRCGLFLAGQPPGRRYAALTAGGHLFAIILNFGAVALLGALVERSLEGDRSERGRLRERRMMTAIHRGFATILAWSPLTVSLAVVLTALPDTGWAAVAPWCLGTAGGLIVLGWALDRAIRPPRRLRSPGPPPRPPGSWALVLPIAGLVVAVFALGFALEELFAVRLVTGVMAAAPVMAALWLLVQERAPAATLRRLRTHVLDGFPAYRLELSILTAAAFVGSLFGALLPHDAVAAALDAVPLPAWGLVAALGWMVVALGQAGLNPVLTVSAVAGVLPPPEVLGVPPAAVAVALTGAWALTAASSPFGAATLIIGQMTGVGATAAGSRWNGPFAVTGLLALTVWVGLVARLAA